MNFNHLDQLARHEGGISRRLFTSYVAALSSVPWIGLSNQNKGTNKTNKKDEGISGVENLTNQSIYNKVTSQTTCKPNYAIPRTMLHGTIQI